MGRGGTVYYLKGISSYLGEYKWKGFKEASFICAFIHPFLKKNFI